MFFNFCTREDGFRKWAMWCAILMPIDHVLKFVSTMPLCTYMLCLLSIPLVCCNSYPLDCEMAVLFHKYFVNRTIGFFKA